MVSNKAASKTLSKFAAGKVSVSFLAPDEWGRKAKLAYLFTLCILLTRCPGKKACPVSR